MGNRHKAGQSSSYNFHDFVPTEALWLRRNQKRSKGPPKPKKPKGSWEGLNWLRSILVHKEKVLRKPLQAPLTLRRQPARATRALIHNASCADPCIWSCDLPQVRFHCVPRKGWDRYFRGMRCEARNIINWKGPVPKRTTWRSLYSNLM